MSLVGENGAGKSTLGNIISGSLKPDTGEIIFDGKRYESLTIKQAEEIGIVMVHQELVMLPELSVTANIFIGSEYTHMGLLDESSMKTQAEQLLKEVGLNLSPDTLVKDIDVAGCQMIEIARAISGDAKLIILDEPTSSLSEKEIEHLFSIVRRLKKKGVSFIFVSHHLQEVMDISDNIYVLKDGHLVTSLDPTSCSIDDIIVNMVGRSLEDFYHRKRNHFGGEAIKLENFSGINVGKRYLNTSCPQNINLTVNEGEIVGISGLVGAGRTELIKLIFCDDPKTADSKLYLFGEQREFRNYKKAIDNGLAWITEDRKHEGLILQFSILSNIALPILDFFKNLLFINRKKEANTVDEYMQMLSGYYDITHGVGLAILTPVWMEYVLDESSVDKFAEYAKNVWDVDDNDKWNAAREGIRKTRECFTSWGMPTKLSELDIDDRYFGDMAQKAAVRGLDSAYKPLFEEDIVNILKRSL